MNSKALEFCNVTQKAAIAAFKWLGKGDEKSADQAAVDAMRSAFNDMDINGTIVIGEGERDKAPMLYIGEKVGKGKGVEFDIAVDPLEGTTILATGADNALSVLAVTNKGGFLHAPDVYMDKIAIGFEFNEQLVDLDNSVKENLSNVAKAQKRDVADLVVTILDRLRHEELIAKIRSAGARVQLIKDGDIAAVINTSIGKSNIYMGIGGAPEGVLAAAALQSFGGQMCGKLIFGDSKEKSRAKTAGITDLSRQYYLNDLASGDIIFAATGVTNGSLVAGINITEKQISTETILLMAKNKEIKFIKSFIPIPIFK